MLDELLRVALAVPVVSFLWLIFSLTVYEMFEPEPPETRRGQLLYESALFPLTVGAVLLLLALMAMTLLIKPRGPVRPRASYH